jgi:hypothetical protein
MSKDCNHLGQSHLPLFYDFFSHHRQVELQKKIAAEVEAEGQRILALQAQLASQQQPQHNQYQGHQGHNAQQSNYNYNAQASNHHQQQAHSGYNSNAQQVGSAKPQQNYLPPGQHNYGK